MVEAESREQRSISFRRERVTPGYVSLDEALTLAIAHARDNRDFYGRYATVELAWGIVGARETQDSYEVRISYRPGRRFRGRPGVEQFSIDKKGQITFRQIISQPRSVWRSPFFLSAIGAPLVVGVALGVLFGAGVLPPSSNFLITGQPVFVEKIAERTLGEWEVRLRYVRRR